MIRLKYVFPELDISENVAIVGSSGRLLETKEGSLIDSFDEVVRFNRAPTDGWEEFCGSKTTLHMANTHVFLGKKFKKGSWEQKNTSFVKDMKDMKILLYGDKATFNKHPDCIDPSSVPYYNDPMYNGILKRELIRPIGRQLTVGMAFIAICISSGIHPHLFGFDITCRPRDHYWEERGPASECHKPSDEKEALAALLSAGLITLH